MAPKRSAPPPPPPAPAASDEESEYSGSGWTKDDEVRILNALATLGPEHGTLPLFDSLAGRLDRSDYSYHDLKDKVSSLRIRYITLAKKGGLPSEDHDRRLFDLSKNVWVVREFDEMCERYPYLAEAVKELHPGLFKREFTMMDDSEARALDKNIKKQRFEQMKLQILRNDIDKKVTNTLMALADQ